MYYFDSKKDLKFLNEFKNVVSEFYASQNYLHGFSQYSYGLHEKTKQIKKIEETNRIAREAVAKKLNKAIQISSKCGVITDGISTPPLLVGGYRIPVNIYTAILNDNSYGNKIGEELVLDTINQAIGQAETNVYSSRMKVKN